jgi:hypothetical protein
MITALGDFATEFRQQTGHTVEFNDISLPRGGRYEVKDDDDLSLAWTNRHHCDHRLGKGTDLRTNPFMGPNDSRTHPSATVNRMRFLWKGVSGFPEKAPLNASSGFEGDHLHLKTVR